MRQTGLDKHRFDEKFRKNAKWQSGILETKNNCRLI
ncbi:MAG: hypothetical protein ALAOOOJD_02257 [bacterium]|nr:hypothetical protein [bacterium]